MQPRGAVPRRTRRSSPLPKLLFFTGLLAIISLFVVVGLQQARPKPLVRQRPAAPERTPSPAPASRPQKSEPKVVHETVPSAAEQLAARLEAEATALFESGDFLGAIAVLRDYDGELAAETRPLRAAAAQRLDARLRSQPPAASAAASRPPTVPATTTPVENPTGGSVIVDWDRAVTPRPAAARLPQDQGGKVAPATAVKPAPTGEDDGPDVEADALGFAELNALLGISLWADDNLWDDPDANVARRLGANLESRTMTQANFSRYTGGNMLLLGLPCYSIWLYGVSGAPERVSFVFINKGDFPGFRWDRNYAEGRERRRLERGHEEVARRFQRQYDDQSRQIKQAIRDRLGKPGREYWGTGYNTRERPYRWDWRGHALLLTLEEDEHIMLRVVSTQLADDHGRVDQLHEAKLRRELETRVETRLNGDVLVTEIPMISQGPKGYCVPATWSRYLQYLGMPVDMNLLALAGGTDLGGGTNVGQLADSISVMVRRHGRKLTKVSPALSFKNVSRYIDRGLPLMWVMNVDPQINSSASSRLYKRRQEQDWDAWKAGLGEYEELAKGVPGRRDLLRAHQCLIIGYNKETGEICFSDSWGPDYAERWITQAEAEAISLGELWIIKW